MELSESSGEMAHQLNALCWQLSPIFSPFADPMHKKYGWPERLASVIPCCARHAKQRTSGSPQASGSDFWITADVRLDCRAELIESLFARTANSTRSASQTLN